MRSQLVFDAMTHTLNRYRLVMLTARAARKLHRPGTRVPSTVNEALERLAGAPTPAAESVTAPRVASDALPSSRNLERTLGWGAEWDNSPAGSAVSAGA